MKTLGRCSLMARPWIWLPGFRVRFPRRLGFHTQYYHLLGMKSRPLLHKELPMNTRQMKLFGRLVEKQKARTRAVEQLQRIAKQYPDLFAEVAKGFLHPEEDADDAGDDAADPKGDSGKLQATEAILNWLEEHTEGTPGDIATALVDKILTRSSRPAAIIYSTLASLKNRKVLKLTRNKDGKKVYVKI